MRSQTWTPLCLCWLNCSGSCVSGWASLGWVTCVHPVPEGQVHGPFYHMEEPHTRVQVLLCVSVSKCGLCLLTQRHGCLALLQHPASVKGEQGREGGLSLGTDKGNVHIPTCRRVILAYPWDNLNFMLTKRTVCIFFNYFFFKRGTLIRSKRINASCRETLMLVLLQC